MNAIQTFAKMITWTLIAAGVVLIFFGLATIMAELDVKRALSVHFKSGDVVYYYSDGERRALTRRIDEVTRVHVDTPRCRARIECEV